jgi:hypothetical protein
MRECFFEHRTITVTPSFDMTEGHFKMILDLVAQRSDRR